MMRVSVVPVTPFQQNSSIVICDKTNKAAVVDPGGEVDRLIETVTAEQVQLEKILVTHAHIDHAGGVAELARRLQLPIEGPHKEDQFWIDLLPEQAEMFAFPTAEAFVPDRWLEDNDTVTVGELEFLVRHCPGHTPGHVIFFQPDNRLAIVGDVLFQGSIGRTDFPRGDHATLLASIKNKLWPLGDDVQFVPGHGPTSTFGQERQSNPFVADHTTTP
ncbi:MAG: MBL fold metallo-hydrolase [Gammaproteobacteria bacterium]